MPVDPIIAPFLDALNRAPKPARDVADLRSQAKARAGESPYAAFIEPGPEVADVHYETIPVRHPPGEIAVRIYRSQRAVDGGGTGALVVYHGGGWFMGTLDDPDIRCRTIANRFDLVVASVDYRLAPEYQFPTPPEDAYEAMEWVAQHAARLGVQGQWLGVAGESAGGNLAAAVALLTRERKGPALALQILEIPGLDLTLSSPSLATYGRGHILDQDDLVWCVDTYLGDHDPKDPIASPVMADDLAGLPPAIILSAECDPLADDGRRYAEQLDRAGVPVLYREFAGHVHGSHTLTALLPSAREWRQTLLDGIGQHLPSPARA